jgi:sugar phosphate isomerase/epimerase
MIMTNPEYDSIESNVCTSIAISTHVGKFSPIPLIGDLSNILPQVADLGYDAVEIHIRKPDEISTMGLDTLLSNYNLRVSAFAPGRAFTIDGLSFIHPDQVIRGAAIARINAFVERAADLGAAVFVGFVRGKVSQDPTQKLREMDLMAESGRKCCEFAEPLGVDILWEPINRYEMDDFNTVNQTLAFIEKIGFPNAKLLLDIFHMNIEEPSILESLSGNVNLTPYIHMVDSNRWAPGFGHINFDAIAITLQHAGFRGVFSAEILPLPDPITAAKKAIDSYHRMMSIMNLEKKRGALDYASNNF